MVADTQTLPVRFTTQTPYPLPAQKFMIPAVWRRYQLSQLVNKALALSQPIPFDFLVRGELLRGSLVDWCKDHGAGMEETLEVEYIESLMPPQRVASIPHDDWISSVSQLPGHFVTASYDGLLRVFDTSLSLTHTISGHTAPVTSVCLIPTLNSTDNVNIDSEPEIRQLASASHDSTVRITSLTLSSSSSPSSRTLATLHLHTGPISSVAASPSGSNLLTAGWDSLVGIWDTTVPASDEVPAVSGVGQEERRKRRRIGAKGAGAQNRRSVDGGEEEAPWRKAPAAVLKSHTTRVTDATFSPHDAHRAFSCGLDSTVRSWDVETGVCVHTMNAPEKPFLALTHLAAPHLLAVAAADRTVSIYDLRSFTSASSAVDTALKASALVHAGTPLCLAASPSQGNGNESHIASGALDGIVRVWDVRSTREALASFRAGADLNKKHGDAKVLGLDWSRGVLAVGGEAGLDIWRVSEGERNMSEK
ncbi:hypothetical protein EW145_g1779 [Phellinidium pouzarii]|uniref:Ribosome biogenesis protein YTM1 n=1 Tax=Phellinidium pouzarii TaxID=167371 RepID=A0A4V3XDH1_9AGAM|nr:hypothetical protein EW145_g1779 [Phellinidium pouzarii]